MSRLSDINNSYGKTFSFAAANTYSTNVLNASKLPASTMIVASPQEDGEDIGQHSLLVTDYNGEAVRLTYDITAGNGLNFSNDALELSIDNDTIIEDNGKLVATLANYADNTTVKSSDGKIKIDSASLWKASSSSQGLAKVDGRTIKSDNGTIYVETSALDIATGTSKGIAHGDNRTIKSANGVLSVISNGLDKASATTYGVLKVDNSTLKSDNGKIYTTHELLKDLDKNGLKLAKADNDTLLQHNGVISVNEDAIPYASELTRGKVKIDDSQFYVDNAGVLHPRPTDSTVIVYDYDEAISLLEEKTASLEKTVSNGLVSNEPEIYSLACDETTTSALAKPEYLEEPINMPLQHVYVSLNVITNCDFRISIRYDDNEPPVVELDDINYANEIKKSGIEAIDFTWPSTNMKEKNVIILFSAKNFYSSTLGKNKTTKLTISVESVEDRTISKQIVYSIIRYNSAFKHDETEYEETATAVVESSETFMINTEDSYVLVTIDDGTQWNQIKYSLNDIIPRSDLQNSPDENILLHGVYTDKNTMTEKYFEAKIPKEKLNSPIPVNSGETYAIYVYCHNDEGEDLFYPINYEIKDPNEVIVNPRSLTVYAMHAADFSIWDRTVVDENLNTNVQYYIEDSRNACTWNEKIQNSYIFDGEYTYQATRESSNRIARISDGSSNLISFVPKTQSSAYAYFNDSIDSTTIYFMHHTKAEPDMTKEQIMSYSASLSISYKNVGINIDYCIDEVQKYVSSSINGLRVHGKIRYAYQIDDGNLEYADMNRFDSSKLVPVKINIENVEGISPRYEPQNTTDHFNDFVIIKSNLVDFSDQTISYSLSYLYDAALGYQFITSNGSYAVDYIYDPILSVSSGITIDDSNDSVSVSIYNPSYEISGLLNAEGYEPTKMIVAYQAIVQDIGAPYIDTTRGNVFAISANSSNPNVYTTYSFYRYDAENQEFEHKETYYGTIHSAAYQSPYLSDTLVVAYNSMNNTYSSIEGFYYFNSQMQAPEVDNYINYMECDGNSINIISYSSITNKEYHRLDKIGDAYSFFTGDTYFREQYNNDNLNIKSSFIYNLSYNYDTVSQNGHEFSLAEFVPSGVSANQINLDDSYIKRYSGDIGQSIHAICKLYNSNGDPINVSYSNNTLTLENNNTFEASYILQAQSMSSDELALSKEHFYLIENAGGDRGLVAENIDDLIYISSYLVSYMSFNPDSSSIVALADTHASSVFAFYNINNIMDIRIIYNSGQELVISNENSQETIFNCTGIEGFKNYYSTHPEMMSFDALITLALDIDGDVKRRVIRKRMPNLFKFDDADNYKMEHFNGFNIPYFDGKVFDDTLTPYDYSFEIDNSTYECTLKFHSIPIIHKEIFDTGIIDLDTYQEEVSTASFFTYEDLGIDLNSTYVPGTLAYSQISYITDVHTYQGALKNICGGFSSSGSQNSSSYYSFQLPMQMQSPFVIQNAQEPTIYLTNDLKHWMGVNGDTLSFKLCYLNGTPDDYGIHINSNYNIPNCTLTGTEIIYNN